ncbi:hypothetical protein [Haloarcula marismortui]|uniref:DUF8160 domain-containing protein n=1 Tax=Haloarcula marismortui ATCC 33800 TaxID=662476 RepID=M0JMJ5_9EURY|nr:hypothetical protein [Haloarcula sinaiiensis]EMA10236.1 hypothetical protein C436_18181 [Haloarcula sinaiiensis ATCC 33800]QUJ75004.1 hypothetical protein KDQ40_22410 [Haloarcula sinaiiensis ATCC 33800]
MSDERSERLRQRRKQSQERAQDVSGSETDEPAETGKSSKPSKPAEPDKQSEPSEPDETDVDEGSVKEEQVGTYMYLPKSQKKDLERLYNILKAEYEYEYDEEFEKNRAFYPLVVKYGLDSLEGLDASEIRERLDSL